MLYSLLVVIANQKKSYRLKNSSSRAYQFRNSLFGMFLGISLYLRSDIASTKHREKEREKKQYFFVVLFYFMFISIFLLCGWHNSSWRMWFESVKRQMNCEWRQNVADNFFFRALSPSLSLFVLHVCSSFLFFLQCSTRWAKVRLAFNVVFHNFAVVTFHLPTIFKWNVAHISHNILEMQRNFSLWPQCLFAKRKLRNQQHRTEPREKKRTPNDTEHIERQEDEKIKIKLREEWQQSSGSWSIGWLVGSCWVRTNQPIDARWLPQWKMSHIFIQRVWVSGKSV